MLLAKKNVMERRKMTRGRAHKRLAVGGARRIECGNTHKVSKVVT